MSDEKCEGSETRSHLSDNSDACSAIRSDAAVLGPQFKFAQHGQSGVDLSEALPHLAGVVDDICLIKSMQTDQFNHAPGRIF
jgi:hypothetical protein